MARLKSEMSAKKVSYGDVVAIVRDPSGKIKQQVKQRIDSFLYAHWKAGFNRFTTGNYSSNLSSINGTATYFEYEGDIVSPANSASSYFGIIVGTGSTAVAFGNTSLASLVTHGSSAGQLTPSIHSMQIDTVNRYEFLERSFVNNSGGTITVNECGVTCGGDDAETVDDCVLVVRDVFSTALTVNNGDTLAVVYQFKTEDGRRNWFMHNIQNLIGGAPGIPTYNNIALYHNDTSYSFVNLNGGKFVADAGDTNEGIVLSTNVSTGNNLTSNATNIIPSTTNGLVYFACNVKEEVFDNTNGIAYIEFQRSVYNNSVSSSYTINSVALIDTFLTSPLGISRQFMFDWKPLTNAITIAPNTGETFVWRIEYEL